MAEKFSWNGDPYALHKNNEYEPPIKLDQAKLELASRMVTLRNFVQMVAVNPTIKHEVEACLDFMESLAKVGLEIAPEVSDKDRLLWAEDKAIKVVQQIFKDGVYLPPEAKKKLIDFIRKVVLS